MFISLFTEICRNTDRPCHSPWLTLGSISLSHEQAPILPNPVNTTKFHVLFKDNHLTCLSKLSLKVKVLYVISLSKWDECGEHCRSHPQVKSPYPVSAESIRKLMKAKLLTDIKRRLKKILLLVMFMDEQNHRCMCLLFWLESSWPWIGLLK